MVDMHGALVLCAAVARLIFPCIFGTISAEVLWRALFPCPPAIIENYRKKRKHMKEDIPMKTTHKLCLVIACLSLLTFSGCTQTHGEPNAFPVEEVTATAEVLTQQLTCFTFDANDTLGSSGYPIGNDRIYRFIVHCKYGNVYRQ